jgi:hypothetical protein
MKQWQISLSGEGAKLLTQACASLAVDKKELTNEEEGMAILLLWAFRRIEKLEGGQT